ncbi:MAG: SET domain-containing protein-lysine N-methyltransferase [candidate division Zixibacteria bacterium]|nr:SET domain-containing protein-lysine N-methyltransferase [candidate division Zixibacteria bacterium]
MGRSKSNGNSHLKVRSSGIQGRGVFAARRIRKGQRIIEYTGEIIDNEEETRRYDDEAMSRHHTYLFKIDETTTIDATNRGNIARFINHSCDPNCEAVWEERRIFIEAARNIQSGVELTYDYAYEHEGPLTPALRQLYFCCCGAGNCRGTILKPKRRKN